MAATKRIPVGPGVAVFLRWRKWWIDVYRRGQRVQRSLGTEDQGEALMLAVSILKNVESKKVEISALQAVASATSWETAKSGTHRLGIREAIAVDFTPGREKPGELVLRLPSNGAIVARHKGDVETYGATRYEAVNALAIQALDGLDIEKTVFSAARAAMGQTALPAVKNEKGIEEYGMYQLNNRRNQKDKKGNAGRWTKQAGTILRNFCVEQKLDNIGDITRQHVNTHLATLRASSTAKNHLTAISGYLNWGKLEAKYVTENVAEGIEIGVDDEKKEVTYHPSEELARLLKAAKGEGLYELLIHWGLYSNLRAGELDAQQAEDINPQRRTINVTKPKKTRRGLKRRWVPLMDELLPSLKKLPRKGKLFPFSVQSGATSRALARIWKKAKLSIVKGEKGLQILRHSWVTHLLQHPAKLNHNTVAQWAGHTPQVQQDKYNGIFKAGDKPWVMTCAMHGIGKRSKRTKTK